MKQCEIIIYMIKDFYKKIIISLSAIVILLIVDMLLPEKAKSLWVSNNMFEYISIAILIGVIGGTIIRMYKLKNLNKY